MRDPFIDRVRAVTWMLVVLALVAFTLYGLAAGWAWPRVVPPAAIAALLGFVRPGWKR